MIAQTFEELDARLSTAIEEQDRAWAKCQQVLSPFHSTREHSGIWKDANESVLLGYFSWHIDMESGRRVEDNIPVFHSLLPPFSC